MPARLFDVNLQAPEPPFLASDINRTALLSDIPEPVPYATNIVRPQAIYMKDTLPSKYGYDSLDYDQPFNTSIQDKHFESVFPFYDNQNTLHFFGRTDSTIQFANDGITNWQDGPSGFDYTMEWTKAYLFGTTFFYASEVGKCYIYDPVSNNFLLVTFAGVTTGTLMGICAGAGYFIAYDKDHIYWTTNVNLVTRVIDFTPVLGTSGSDQILEIKSDIICVLAIQRGFIIYSLANAVIALFSGNSSTPFNYSEILGSAGVASQFQVASDQNTGSHYAWTSAGLQQLGANGATDLFPELLEFLNLRTLEVLDPITGIFTRTTYEDVLAVRLNFIENRFLIISYGPSLVPSLSGTTYNDLAAIDYNAEAMRTYNSFLATNAFPNTYLEALIYDLDLKRWGKIVEPHSQIFSYSFVPINYYILYNDEAAVAYNDLSTRTYNSMVNYTIQKIGYKFGALHSDGTIKTYSRSNMYDPSIFTPVPTLPCDSVLMFGRIQFYKIGSQDVQECEVEQFVGRCFLANSYTDNPLKPSLSQQGADITNGVSYDPNNLSRRYGFRLAGKYQNITFVGKYHMTAVVAKVNRNGNR